MIYDGEQPWFFQAFVEKMVKGQDLKKLSSDHTPNEPSPTASAVVSTGRNILPHSTNKRGVVMNRGGGFHQLVPRLHHITHDIDAFWVHQS